MSPDITPTEHRALAELRYRIRHFLREGDAKARAVGLEPQQYLMLLAIHRLEAHGYVRRTRSRDDRRCVFVSLLPRGDRLLEQVTRNRISEIRTSGETFVGAIEALLDRSQRDGNNQKKPAKRGARESRA